MAKRKKKDLAPTTAEPPAEPEPILTGIIEATESELNRLCDQGVNVVSVHATPLPTAEEMAAAEPPVDPRLLDYIQNQVYHEPDITDPDYYMAHQDALIEGVKPQDPIELMIAGQLVAHHTSALHWNCKSKQETVAGHMSPLERKHEKDKARQAANIAQGHTRVFCQLVETLNRHRGKTTTQKMVVERVDVAEGGQALVGQVQAGGGSKGGQ